MKLGVKSHERDGVILVSLAFTAIPQFQEVPVPNAQKLTHTYTLIYINDTLILLFFFHIQLRTHVHK